MILPFYINQSLKAYFEVASADRRALLDSELFNTDPLTCKKEYLPLLALEAGVDIDGFSEGEQREMIVNAFKSFNRAGTIGALKESLSVIAPMKIEEQENFTFNVKMPFWENGIYTKKRFEKIFSVIEDKKNVRSVFADLKLNTLSEERINTSSALCIGVELNKNLEVDWVHESNINTTSAINMEVKLAKDLELTFNSNTNLTGAVIWQV